MGIGGLILSVVTYLIGEYHNLEINNEKVKNEDYHLQTINFPNKIIDTFLYLATLISINLTSGMITFIIALTIAFMRLVVSYYFPYYQGFTKI
jgi:uncharacterized membrane protein